MRLQRRHANVRRKGTPLLGCPFHSEQSRDYEDQRRRQRRGQFAPDADAVDPTARLAGFDIEHHFHGDLRRCARGPLL